jgi:translocation and assembly module TamA
VGVVVGLVLALAAGAAPARGDTVRVEIEGIDGDLLTNARAFLSLWDRRREELDPAQIRRLHERGEDEIRRALQPFGYYRAEVTSELVRENQRWLARYVVDPGPPVLLAEVDVRVTGPGAQEPGFRRLVREFPLRPGDAARHRLYDVGRSRLIEHSAARGYLDADFTIRQLQIDLVEYRGAVVLHMDTGPRYYFGEVTFEQDILRDELLERYLLFEPGDPFDMGRLVRLQDALSASPYFQAAEVLPQRAQAVDLHVPIVVHLVPAPRQRWVVGGGYGSDTGLRGTVSLDINWLNRRGHRAEIDARLSELETLTSGSYVVPRRYPRTDLLRYSLGYADVDTRTFERRTFLASVALTTSRGRWRESFSLSFRDEDFRVGVDVGSAQLLIPEASWTRVVADDRLYPRDGRRFTILARGASDAILADTNLIQGIAHAKSVRGFARDVRLIVRADGGVLLTEDFRSLPASLRFFAGGEASVRGYAYQELGGVDREGNVIGGDSLLTASIEVDWLFLERLGRWGLAAFFDAGNAMRAFEGDVFRGVGAGVRWLSPVGMLRVDFAWGLDRPGTPMRLHISLGPEL